MAEERARTIRRAPPLKFSRDTQSILRLASILSVELILTAQALVASGYNSEQAADVLGIKPATLRRRLFRLREKVRTTLAFEFASEKAVESNLRYGADDRIYKWASSAAEEEAP